jgi:hypothetical protein
MKTKIAGWFWKHRATIGYSIGCANVVSGLMNIALGNVAMGLFWVGIGLFIVWDVKTYK